MGNVKGGNYKIQIIEQSSIQWRVSGHVSGRDAQGLLEVQGGKDERVWQFQEGRHLLFY